MHFQSFQATYTVELLLLPLLLRPNFFFIMALFICTCTLFCGIFLLFVRPSLSLDTRLSSCLWQSKFLFGHKTTTIFFDGHDAHSNNVNWPKTQRPCMPTNQWVYLTWLSVKCANTLHFWRKMLSFDNNFPALDQPKTLASSHLKQAQEWTRKKSTQTIWRKHKIRT